MAELVLKEESYKLMELMFRVHNQLGPSYKEKNYQKGVEAIFLKEKVKYEREKEVMIPFEGGKLGGFFVDFIVWGKIILEIKAKPFITKEDIRQVLRYLQATGLPLAIIVNFKREKLEYKRVINSNPKIRNSRILDSSSLEPISDKLVKCLGIDWGEARIGLALADSETKLATPFLVVSSLDEVLKAIKEEEVDLVVVGLPLKMSDSKEKVDSKFSEFLDLLKSKLSISVETFDERLSSKAVDSLAGDKKIKADRDAVAAMLILQGYLDKKYNANAADVCGCCG